MRTQGILLVRDAVLLLSALPAHGESYTSGSSVLHMGLNFAALQMPMLGFGGSRAIRS